ncbi:thiamine-phosphate kinase [Thalassolituus sp.]|uniref:thiamine-phosphate kinase n=1 Tax=Thalassolituus sp. TaxID=2030822 RepID=UPI003516645B
MSRPSEFDLIRDCFASGYPLADDLITGVGDDCSVIRPPFPYDLAQSIDTQVADVHFPASAPAHLIASRALRCAASDLAAMGARPQGFHLALTLPDNDPSWLGDFADGLRRTAAQLGLPLLGGDTTRGTQLVITVAVQGYLPQGQRLERSGAQVGDDIWLSGPVGAAALILPTVLAAPATDNQATAPYYHPSVHLGFGQKLLSLASAAMDISDGLLQDAGHIARASDTGLSFDACSIPTAVSREHPRWSDCLTGGDDYQILFTASPENASAIEAAAMAESLSQCRRVGRVTAESGKVSVWDGAQLLNFQTQGYEHF